MTGPRNQPAHAGLAPADRWLLAALMLAASVLVAVMTSALTVSGMQRAGAPIVAARHDSALTVASTPPVPARDPLPAAQPVHTDSLLVAATAHAADSAPRHEDAGTVGTPPATAPQRSAPHAHAAPRPVRAARRDAGSPGKRALSVAERPRVVPPALAGPAQQLSHAPVVASSAAATAQAPAQPVAQPVVQAAPPPVTAVPAPAASTPVSGTTVPAAAQPAGSPNTNAQFLEELRAIHAEIDARKRHMDSLTRSLDSLKKISPPR